MLKPMPSSNSLMADSRHPVPWPSRLWLVRHGESAGNVARDEAYANKQDFIEIAIRDMDVPLSPYGESQATALGDHLAELAPGEQPTAVLCSPYVRAHETARLALDRAGLGGIPIDVDERLREREFGILDRLTGAGIRDRYPEQAAARKFLGKFYHRPPGGESWCDVGLRARSVMGTVTREYAGERLLCVTHQVVIMMMRYVLEHLTEAEILKISHESDVANCSVTTFAYDASLWRQGGLRLRRFNDVAHIERSAAPVTDDPDVPAGRR
ncbi:MAG: histidine phosphatase family protein [Candidatus Dormibacteria bacterium]